MTYKPALNKFLILTKVGHPETESDGSTGPGRASGRVEVMAMKAYADFDAFVADQGPAPQALIRKLRRLVKRAAPALVEGVKWGNGCWTKGKKPVAFVHAAPDHLQFGFFAGALLKDPRKLLRGSGAWVRHVRIASTSDIDPPALTTLLRQAAKTKYANYD